MLSFTDRFGFWALLGTGVRAHGVGRLSCLPGRSEDRPHVFAQNLEPEADVLRVPRLPQDRELGAHGCRSEFGDHFLAGVRFISEAASKIAIKTVFVLSPINRVLKSGGVTKSLQNSRSTMVAHIYAEGRANGLQSGHEYAAPATFVPADLWNTKCC